MQHSIKTGLLWVAIQQQREDIEKELENAAIWQDLFDIASFGKLTISENTHMLRSYEAVPSKYGKVCIISRMLFNYIS